MQSAAQEIEQSQLVITNLEALPDGVNVSWSDGHQSFFHAIWLRDCCYCDRCGDCYSSKRFVTPVDIPEDLSADSVLIDRNGGLEITWHADGHRSRYAADWLRRHCYDDASRQSRFHEPRLWDATIADQLPEIDFSSARSDERARFQMLCHLRDAGFVVVRGGPARAGVVEEVASLVGDLGEAAYTRVFDLSPSGTVQTMGATFHEVPPHTDEAFRYAPPGVNVLGCLRPASDGGESILVDGFHAAHQLRRTDPACFDLLVQYGQDFNRMHGSSLDQRSRQPMIVLDDRQAVIGIRVHTRAAGPLNLPSEIVKPYYEAYRRFCSYLFDAENQVQFQLRAGDAILFDNHRVLHARTAFTDPRRHLQIGNVPRETFHEQLRLLAARLDRQQEADQVLPAGVS